MVIFQKEKIAFFVSAVILLMSFPLYAYDDSYFSLEKFDREYDTSNIPAIAKQIRIRPEIFIKSINAFTLSLQLIRGEDYRRAEDELRRSIKYWPEFLPAHFVLARLYEITDNKRGVLKQYKIYLSLLKRLNEGKLRATKVLLIALGFIEFETYHQAYDRIISRLEEQNIARELEFLKTAEAEPTLLDTIFKNPYIIRVVGLLIVAMVIIGVFGEGIVPDNIREIFLFVSIPVVVIAMLWLLYNLTANKFWLIIAYLIIPVSILLYIAKKVYPRYWLKHRKPFSGYWICKKCGAENPNIYTECSKCSFEK